MAKKAAEALKVEADALKTQQKSLRERIADAGGITDYIRQQGGWDKFRQSLRDEQQIK